ncbi:MAG: N-formylglutamate amidohydrolase [Betaproteobacteria bacterium]
MNDVPPFVRHAPKAATLPLVLDSPHSGEHYPDDFDHAPPRAIVRQAEDTHVARLYRNAPAIGATLIEAMFPRAYIDANRSLDDIDPAMIKGVWPSTVAASRKTGQGVGLLWRIARGGAPMYTRPLTVDEVQARIDRWYLPYHAALESELDALHREFGAVWHINCHSMPAVGDANADDAGRPRKDFVLGDRDGTTCAPEFTALVAETVEGLGYSVAINDPYKGVELVRRHGRPAQRRHSLQIELNRRLYMDETTLEPTFGYADVEADLHRLLARVADYVRSQV